MVSISNANRSTQLYMHTLASVLAHASEAPAILLRTIPDSERDLSPATHAYMVEEMMDATIAEVDAKIRANTIGWIDTPPETLGRRLVQRGEMLDAKTQTYTTGPGFDALVRALLADTISDQATRAIADGILDQGGGLDG